MRQSSTEFDLTFKDTDSYGSRKKMSKIKLAPFNGNINPVSIDNFEDSRKWKDRYYSSIATGGFLISQPVKKSKKSHSSSENRILKYFCCIFGHFKQNIALLMYSKCYYSSENLNKPRTAKVGAISKAQNLKGGPFGLCETPAGCKKFLKKKGGPFGDIFPKKFFNEIFEQCHSAEKCKRGDPLQFFDIHCVAKHQKN